MTFYQDELGRSPELAACDAALKRWPDVVYRACLEYDLHREVRLSRTRLRSFLGHFAGEWTKSGMLEPAWRSASEAWKLRGPAGTGGALVRVFRWRTLADWLETDRGTGRGTGDDLLEELLASQDPADLGALRLGHRDDPVWGCFDPASPGRHPGAGRAPARLMDLLGLPWYPGVPNRGYPRSGRIVALRFEVPDTSVPTIADAGWDNPWWMPAPAKGGHGRARDVAGLTRDDLGSAPRRPGLAELVLPNREARSVLLRDPADGCFLKEIA